MIRVAVVDDETQLLPKVESIVQNSFHSEIDLLIFSSSLDFLNYHDIESVDILFLDIDMPDLNGFQLAEKLRTLNKNITIIFMSHLEHLVYQSFSFSPFWFVRKSSLETDISEAITHYEASKMEQQFSFQTGVVNKSCALSEILYFESMSHDIFVHLTNLEIYKINRDAGLNLQILETNLSGKGFIRVHRSYLVNYEHIYVINRQTIELKSQEMIQVNPHKTGEIKKIYQQFLMTGGSHGL